MVETPFRVDQIDHVELFVPDFDAALAWYRDVLGLVPVPAMQTWADAGQPLMISSDGGNTMLALFSGDGPSNHERDAHARVAFRVDAAGFLAFLDHIEQPSVRDQHRFTLSRADVVDHDLAYSVYFNDPYGNRFEVTCYDHDVLQLALRDRG